MLKPTLLTAFHLFAISLCASQMPKIITLKKNQVLGHKRFSEEISNTSEKKNDGQPEDKRQKLIVAEHKDDTKNSSNIASNSDRLSMSSSSQAFNQASQSQGHSSTTMEDVFIYDAYTQRRGRPAMLSIHCSSCRNPIMTYQKDGPGRLLRCYLDRIHSPKNLKDRQYDRGFNVTTSCNLNCPKCLRTIGTPMIYAPEARPAYNLIKSRFYFKK